MAQQAPQEVICRYLQDSIAAEENFEKQLRQMSQDAQQEPVKQLFSEHAQETQRQIDRLRQRLQALGGQPSTMKGWMATMFGMAPKTAQMGHEESEKGVQDLVMAYAVENSEVAMYEALAVAASACGDTETERLARDIQQEERRTAERVWDLIPSSSRQSFQQVTGMQRAA